MATDVDATLTITAPGNRMPQSDLADASTVAVRRADGVSGAASLAALRAFMKEGMNGKDPVVAASTAAGTLASDFEAGDTLDGVTLAEGDRILLKDQAAGAENGIYVVNATGAPSRATDADTGDKFIMAVVGVSQGTVNDNKAFLCTNNSVTLGSTSITFVNFATALTGLSTTDSPQFAGINLGHASDTTLTRVSAGVVAIEGVNVVTETATQTLTNKTLTSAVVGTGLEVGHATDTTLTRSAAGKVAVEGKAVPLMDGAVDLVIAGPTVTRTLTIPDADGTAVTLAATQTLTNKTLTSAVVDTGLEVGHATDTTLTRSAAGKIAIEGKAVPLMSGAVNAVFSGPTATRTYAFPDTNGTVLLTTSVPVVQEASQAVLASEFTDGGGTVGTLILGVTVPLGAVLLGSKVTVDGGFAGDTTCTLTIGDGSDVDRYMTGTPSIFATAANGIQTGEPSGNRLITSANTPTLTITSSTDISLVIAEAGSMTVKLYYIATV